MPKKGKKSKSKNGPAMTAKLDELREMKASRDRLTGQLDIKSTQFMNLQQEYQRAQDLIHNLERRLRKETDSLKQELQLRIEEHSSVGQELQFELATQRERIKLHESQLAASEAVIAENEILRKRVANLNEILAIQSADHASTMHSMNSDRFNMRLQLEQAFRKALVEAKEKSQEDALQAMSDESKRAIQLNHELKGELQTQARGIRKMCEHFDMRDEELKAAKLQNRLHESQIDSMTAELTRLTRTIHSQNMKIKDKDESIANAQKSVEAAEAREEKLKEEVKAKLTTIQEKDNYIKTMQARIHFLSQKLNKAISRRGLVNNLSPKLRSVRQKQLLMESAKISRALPQSDADSTRSNTAPADSRLLSASFQDSADSDDVEEVLNPELIWNASLRNKDSSMRNISTLQSVTYPNRSPLTLNGKRSQRKGIVSSQFVP